MDLELENRVSKTSTSSTSNTSFNEAHALLAQSDTDEAKRLKDEATSILDERYANLAGMNVIDILKVIGNVNTWVPEAQKEITELCISIAFPLVILQCRSLANLLASISKFDDHGRVPDIAWSSQQLSVFRRLSEGFDSYWRGRWIDVFSRWKREAQDSSWLNAKVGGMRKHLAETWPIFISIEEALGQITTMTGISFRDPVENIRRTFEMFKVRLAECAAKVDELRVEVEDRSRHLSPFPNPPRAQSWTSGTNISSSGIVQRTSFRRGNSAPKSQPGISATKKFQKQRAQATKLLEFVKSPVLLILAAAIPSTIYSTILCETPDDLPIVDSNFWSTLSQCITGFAGLYVIVRPMLNSNDKDKIQTGFPKVFYTMLILSFATNIVSAVAYAWSPPASIPLAYVSGLTLNFATLLIIQDSGNQIKQTNRENAVLAVEVDDLEMELAGYRAQI
ncbi:hypothetical protein EDB80DRAFT_775014 [Ilyonectria destructans]|nr:hypothetical protein EDB80DRAFT_775014 [Ilyonectria destructans]